MSFPRYPRYKDSGVEWLGEIPSHWGAGRLSYACELIVDGTHRSPVTHPVGEFRYVTAKNIKEHGFDFSELTYVSEQDHREIFTRCPVRKADVLYIKDGATAGLALVNSLDEEFSLLSSVALIRPRPSVFDARFVAYHLNAGQFKSNVLSALVGGAMTRFTLDQISRFSFVIPPIPDQKSIVAFLDQETVKIDSLVVEQQRLIELLTEKRQAIISVGVTKGLDRDAPRKQSGVEPLGDVPVHWTVMPLKRLITRIEQGWSPQCNNEPASPDEWGVLKVGCTNGNEFSPDEQKALPEGVDPMPQYEVRSGDILMSRGNTQELVGSAAYVRNVRPRLLLSDLLYRFRTRPDLMEAEFVVLSLRSPYLRHQIEVASVGSSASMKKIGQEAIRELRVCVPPLEEQRSIVLHVNTQVAALDSLVVEAERAIDLLQEHRAVLIFAAVTGMIDVRGIVATNPEAA